MPALPSYKTPMQGRQISAGEIAKLQSDVASLFTPNVNSAGLVMQTGPFGNRLVDQRPNAFWAIITGDGYSSNSSSDGSSSSDQGTNYDWQEATPVFIDGNWELVAKEGGRYGTSSDRPAVEVNRNTDVPTGSCVWLEPGVGAPDHYLFAWAGDASSDQQFSFEIDCDNGTITVGDPPPTTSSKISSSGGGTGVTPKPNGGGPGTVDTIGGNPGGVTP